MSASQRAGTLSRQSNLWPRVDAALRAKDKRCFLDRGRTHAGEPVVAARCPMNHPPHRYTLQHGVACWKYWFSLEEAAGDLGIEL